MQNLHIQIEYMKSNKVFLKEDLLKKNRKKSLNKRKRYSKQPQYKLWLIFLFY